MREGTLPNVKGTKLKLALTGSSCDNSGVTGGKAPITDVALKATGTLNPGGSCVDVSTVNVERPFKATTKWQGRNSSNRVMTRP